MKKQNVQLNVKQCHNLEQLINHAENPKEIISLLETKMVKQTKIETILRLLCLFSVTQSGLK
jgi:6-phosphogluconate dehydrogenase